MTLSKWKKGFWGERCGQRERTVVRPCHPVCGKILGGKWRRWWWWGWGPGQPVPVCRRQAMGQVRGERQWSERGTRSEGGGWLREPTAYARHPPSTSLQQIHTYCIHAYMKIFLKGTQKFSPSLVRINSIRIVQRISYSVMYIHTLYISSVFC